MAHNYTVSFHLAKVFVKMAEVAKVDRECQDLMNQANEIYDIISRSKTADRNTITTALLSKVHLLSNPQLMLSEPLYPFICLLVPVVQQHFVDT